MSRKKVRMIKKILGAYLMIVGILLSIDVYDQKPSNMQLIFVIASIMIIVGFLYLIQDFREALEKYMAKRAEQNARIQEEERVRRHQELHSSDKFRTAPMSVVKPVKLENIEENLEEFDEKIIIVTDYEEDKPVEAKTTDQETKAADEKKNDKETTDKKTTDKKKESDDTNNLAINITDDTVVETEEKEETEKLAINIEVSTETDDEKNADVDKEEN